ncbi:predicted protein [Postia placenta Mad-698-R]|nr:predicted protein [Postia placenta Mad-698-R]
MSAVKKAQELRALIRMISDASEVVISDWECTERVSLGRQTSGTASSRPSSASLYEAQRIISGACGMCVDLVEEPESRLSAVGFSFFLSRALHVAIRARVADVLARGDQQGGVFVGVISKEVGIDEQKLSRILRALCTVHIFTEVKDGYFANSSTSQPLVGNEFLRCWILLHSAEVYTASDKLLLFLFDPVKTHSTSPTISAWQDAIGSNLTLWEYLERGVEQPNGSVKPRADLGIYALGMIGGGHAFASTISTDYPWNCLGTGTLVDVGGGVGGTSLDLAKQFPHLHFVVEDREPTIEQAKVVWSQEYPEAIGNGRVRLLTHDFFTEQPIRGARVYFLRHILHDWPDDECVAILSQLRKAMCPESIVLIADKVVHTTAGSSRLKSAPWPLPPNYGSAHQSTNVHDLVMMAVHNGMERTPEMFSALATRAGLTLTRIWECQSSNALVEMRLPGVRGAMAAL